MQKPTLSAVADPNTRTPGPQATPDKKQTARTAQAAPQRASDTGRQTRALFGQAARPRHDTARLRAELTQTGSRQISATSLMSRTPERVDIQLPATRINGGWKAQLASGQDRQNLAAVRSDATGRWTVMPDKMEAAGQNFSLPRRYTKSVENPVQGPYPAPKSAELVDKMLANIAHLRGQDFLREGGSVGGVVSAQRIMEAIRATQGLPGQVYVYKLNGEPVALMKGSMQPNELDPSFHIQYLVSDPYARGAGTTMIEKAVNVSLQNGTGGTVTLNVATKGAKDQYLKLGFSAYSPFHSSVFVSDLKLDPSQSPLWENVGDRYVYVGNRDQKYVTGLGRPGA